VATFDLALEFLDSPVARVALAPFGGQRLLATGEELVSPAVERRLAHTHLAGNRRGRLFSSKQFQDRLPTVGYRHFASLRHGLGLLRANGLCPILVTKSLNNTIPRNCELYNGSVVD